MFIITSLRQAFRKVTNSLRITTPTDLETIEKCLKEIREDISFQNGFWAQRILKRYTPESELSLFDMNTHIDNNGKVTGFFTVTHSSNTFSDTTKFEIEVNKAGRRKDISLILEDGTSFLISDDYQCSRVVDRLEDRLKEAMRKSMVVTRSARQPIGYS